MIHVSHTWDKNKLQSEAQILSDLIAVADLSDADRDTIVDQATHLIDAIRTQSKPGLMEVFLAEYGLSTDEGVALMCLAEALLRVPDKITVDALIDDKITPAEWAEHLGQSPSTLVNASSLGLLISSKVLGGKNAQVAKTLRTLIQRLGEPVIRAAVTQAIRQMGDQFVLGETIESAQKRATKLEGQGYTYSYDMLGEAAVTHDDAQRYINEYSNAIDAIAQNTSGDDVTLNPGISVKLSALHPRYELAQADRVLQDIVPVLQNLARKAAQAGIGLNVDAEEADRLGLSMDIISATLAHSDLANWQGFGVVVQAYSKRAPQTIDALYALAKQHNRKIMVRLVKGAYWDSEIKHSQVQGLTSFPVFTRKEASDVSYIANARKLLQMNDFIYPQFATHNAHSISAILHMAQQTPNCRFEFQRLHGMGEAVHNIVVKKFGTNCRIYAPVGPHKDLLAYLVRRLLENGANSSFVNQIADPNIPSAKIAACPFKQLASGTAQKITSGPDIYGAGRINSKGYDLNNAETLSALQNRLVIKAPLSVAPILVGEPNRLSPHPIVNPANGDHLGTAQFCDAHTAQQAIENSAPWYAEAAERQRILLKAADLYEAEDGEALALLMHEAGKTLADAVGELREAVDFLRYYAAQIAHHQGTPRGIFTCISPWNFPLAIFTGQIAAALAAGNGVLAKPAETTSAIAAWAISRLHRAGVPKTSLQLVLGTGSEVGNAVCAHPKISGVAFTGSTQTAKTIQNRMADMCQPGTPLIAETGGLNAMIVDSTALPEQAVRDIITSAFQSAGQRCSALRCLYIQRDIAPELIKLLLGAMDELVLGDPINIQTDVGPVITAEAANKINGYIENKRAKGSVLYEVEKPNHGNFVAPCMIQVDGIQDLKEEIFGPVLHVATFDALELDTVIQTINETGYGLTFGLHTRIENRLDAIAKQIHCGNIYVNRNQIGAIVGSQPFGGEGLSGTGPKAGGPNYVGRFTRLLTDPDATTSHSQTDETNSVCFEEELPGPTGERNLLRLIPRDPLLCAGPTRELAEKQAAAVKALGGRAIISEDDIVPDDLAMAAGFSAVIWWGDTETGHAFSRALARRNGPIIPLIVESPDRAHVFHERHLCIDTTAAGGNAALLIDQSKR
jgi:RHH-type proline utilization regulon transcriptional repressor/proline dehydrogenase/delta 1-pyrroline-5-carboxylate dehydrogenase